MGIGSGIVQVLGQLTAPLRLALEDQVYLEGLLEDLGWKLRLSEKQAAVLRDLLPSLDDLQALSALGADIEAGSATAGALVARALELGQSVFARIKALAAVEARSLATLPAPLNDPAAWDDMALELPELLLVQWIALNRPVLYTALVFAGIVTEHARGDNLPPRRELSWQALQAFLQDPARQMTSVYNWGGTLRHERLFNAIAGLANAVGLPVRLVPIESELAALMATGGDDTAGRELRVQWRLGRGVDRALSDAALVVVPVAARAGGAIQGLLVTNRAAGDSLDAVELGPGVRVEFRDGAYLDGAVGFTLLPAGVMLTGPAAKAEVSIAMVGAPQSALALLGEEPGTRLELDTYELQLAIAGGVAEPEVVVSLGTGSGLRLVLEGGDGDHFVAELLGALPLIVKIPCSASWSSKHGFLFHGSAGFTAVLQANVTAGPLSIQSLRIALFGTANGATAEVAVTGALSFGPFVAVVDGLGLSGRVMSSPGQTGGLLGNLDIAVAFKPPDAIGLSLDVGPIAGGGFLKIDPDAGEYAGVLELELLSVGVSAIGLINTKLPGGGWSLFLALFIEVPAIQLGFGFTLNGVGGLAGVNRTVAREGLQSVIRSGSLDSVLFPKDPIRDAPRTIEAVQTLFPSAPGQYVFGPVVKLGWGTPTLVEAVLGIVIALPELKLVVLGSVTAVLPTPEANLVGLHLEVGGYIEPAAGLLEISAGLHDSHIAGFPLSGGMALLLELGAAPTFLMALGGCHPRFERPAGFPELDRLALAIGAGDFIAIRFACYFALSSNSLQFGSAFELTAEVEGFAINGSAEFDALVSFAPFSLRTSLHFDISVTAVGVDLLAVRLDVSLSGPNPWHVVGTASFDVLGFETRIRLDRRIGARRPDPPPLVEDLLGQLQAALAAPAAWSAGPGGGLGVRFAADEPQPDELVVAPDGTLGVAQRVVPLGITIDRGEPWQIEGGYSWFDLEAVEPGLAISDELSDWFALSAYKDPSPSEQLSAPSFEQLKSGLTFGGGPTAGVARVGTLDYERKLRDPELGAATVDLPAPRPGAAPHLVSLTGIAALQLAAGYTIAADAALPAVALARFVPVDRLSGAALGPGQSWAASRLSPAGRRARSAVVPSWEVENE